MTALVALLLVVLGLCAGGLLGRYWAGRRHSAELQVLQARWQDEAAQRSAGAVAQERERIYNDLHDDLGAKLLQMIYAAPDPAFADQARAALQDLRDVVTRSRGAVGTLEQVLGEIRQEASQRLAAAGTGLRWEQPEQLPSVPLQQVQSLHLYRIVREAISNALRHAQAGSLRVRVKLSAQQLALELTDDGSDTAASSAQAGQGMQNMQQRAEALHGAIEWARGTEGGTKVLLTMPLN